MALAETARLIAALELQDKFSKPLGGAMNSLGRAEKRIGTLGKIGDQAGRGLGNAARNIERIGLAVGGLAVGGLVASLKMASDLNENINKTQVVFGAAADEVLAFSETTADSLGLSRNATLDAAGAFGNMFTTIGLANDASAGMSTRLVTLAADMASFNNEDPTEMLLKIRSGLAGEAEPLRRFGVLLSEAAVKEEAYRTGIVKRGKALTEAQKVQARYSLILKQTAIQQGDFARTSDGLANLQRRLTANLQNTGTVIGTALLPQIVKMASAVNSLVSEHQPDIERFAATLPAAFDKLTQFGANLPWGAIGDAFKAMGTGSKILLDAFLGLPPWVQTAVLTGWGLNKLTGGALGNIVGALGSGLIKGVLGMNVGVVNINAAVVNGAGGVPTPGPKFSLKSLLLAGGAAGVGAAGTLFSQGSNVDTGTQALMVSQAAHKFGATIDSVLATGATLGALKEFADNQELRQGVDPKLLTEIDALASQLGVIKDNTRNVKETGSRSAAFLREATAQGRQTALNTANAARMTQATLGPLGVIAAKPPPTANVTVNVSTSVSVSDTLRRMTSTWISSGKVAGIPL